MLSEYQLKVYRRVEYHFFNHAGSRIRSYVVPQGTSPARVCSTQQRVHGAPRGHPRQAESPKGDHGKKARESR